MKYKLKLKLLFQKIKLLKVLSEFFDYPRDEFYAAELAKKTGISTPSMVRYLGGLYKHGFLERKELGRTRLYRLNMNPFLRQLKISYNVERVFCSGLLQYILENTSGLNAVVLYGSWAKGANTNDSDIDLLVVCDKNSIDLEKLEKIVKRRVDMKVMKMSKWLKQKDKNRGFYLEVLINGIALYGNLPVVV